MADDQKPQNPHKDRSDRMQAILAEMHSGAITPHEANARIQAIRAEPLPETRVATQASWTTTSRSPSRTKLISWAVGLAIAVVLLIVGLTAGGSHSNEPSAHLDATCSEWGTMSSADRTATTREAAQRLDAKSLSDSFIAEFAHSITTACAAYPEETVKEVAATLATVATGDFN